jgi:hypothetical protein
MPCYRPINVAIQRKPQRVGGYRTRDTQKVPCGNCLGCRSNQAFQWAIRMVHEAQYWADKETGNPRAWFLTLTYDNEHLPGKWTGHAPGTLVPEHLSAFLRSLRDATGEFSHYAVGEYGDKGLRPHYHAVCFGPEFLDRRLIPLRNGSSAWRSETLETHWVHGHAEFSALTMGSAAYVAGYVRKKVAAAENPDLYLRVDPDTGELHELHPEFSSMSRRPAIGNRWIRENWRNVYAHDRVVIDGYEVKPPRYYDKWMETDHTDTENPCPEGCEEHLETILRVKFDRWDPDVKDDTATLRNREANHKARIALFQQRDTF